MPETSKFYKRREFNTAYDNGIPNFGGKELNFQQMVFGKNSHLIKKIKVMNPFYALY